MAVSRNQFEKKDEKRSSGIDSALKHLAGQVRDWMKGIRGVKEMGLITQERTRTFQGRHVVRMKWEGREVEVVEGLLAYSRAFPAPVEITRAEEFFGCGVEEVTKIDELGIGLIAFDHAVQPKSISMAATQLGEGISWIEPVMIDHGAVTPNDPLFAQQWALKEIKAEAAWDLWKGASVGDSNDVVLALLDSGIPIINGVLSHPDLNDPMRFILGSDLVHKGGDPADDHGHGTHVTGIAAASPDNNLGIAGLYWEGTVLTIKAMNSNQPPDASSDVFEKAVLEAIGYANKLGARLVINYSGEGPPNNTKETAVGHIVSNDALLIAAAGNDHGGPVGYPAAYSTKYSNVMAVGAVNRKRSRPSWASRGPELTVVAPGADVLSCFPNYRVTVNSHGYSPTYDRMDGTSMATPLVAALAALVWSKWPNLTATQVRDKITQSADPLGSKNDFGSGIVNAEAALL
jgi:thermitase